ncbi:MAG: hypothetical protein NUV67_03580 [archaeon]|nr:hypothetical protein [archaeon]
MGDRILLAEALRKEFFETAKSSLGAKSMRQLAFGIGINYSAFKNYRRGKLTIPIPVFDKLTALLGEEQKGKFLSGAKFFDSNWGAVKGGKKGIAAVMAKYGEAYLQDLRKRGNNASLQSPLSITHAKEITIPQEVTPEVAEILGAYLGDGTLTDEVMRISVSRDLDIHYLPYLSKQIKKIFGIIPNKIRFEKGKNLAYLNISSVNFVKYFKETFGLKTGDKIRNKAVIPGFILADENLARSCLRGLMDTDGSYCKRGSQMSLDFSSHNSSLLKQVFELGRRFGYFSYNGETNAGSNSWLKAQKYFSEVGSSNLKHVIRFRERLKTGRLLYAKDTLKYFPEYENLSLPYLTRSYGLLV